MALDEIDTAPLPRPLRPQHGADHESAGGGRVAAAAGALRPAAGRYRGITVGRMLAFSRNRFAGSYLFFNATSRS